MAERIDIYLYLEDWDNFGLNGYDWSEWMREAVLTYNEEYGTDYKPDATIAQYVSMQREKRYGDI